nr:hypothetical protein [Tanacetum cinerariifolium]
MVDWTYHNGESDGVIASKEFGIIADCDTEDAIEEGAAKIYNLITREFALMGVTSEESLLGLILYRTPLPIKGVLRSE